MPRTYSGQYRRKQEYLSELVDNEESAVTAEDAEAIRELCNAFDEDTITVERPQWPDAPKHLRKYREDGTLANWMYFLTEYARRVNLLNTTHGELNQVAQDWHDGGDQIKVDAANESDKTFDGLAKGTIRAYQTAARIFYRYHDVEGVNRERIAVFDREDTSIDPRDMLTGEEIQSVRDAPDNTRNAAIVDMLLYTGLRNNGLRTLRIKDVDPFEGVYHFNTGDDGLKNIHQPNAPRPLLGAAGRARDWLDYHPFADDEEAYFICGNPKYGNPDPHEPVSDRTIQRVMDTVKEMTGIDKPMHPHMMRHNFVSICKRDYGMDDGTVKFLIGHNPDSNVMETTYAHLSAEDYQQKAEEAAGLRDPEDESSLTPNHCSWCREPIPIDHAKYCPNCRKPLNPGAWEDDEAFDDAVYEEKGKAGSQYSNEAVDALRAAAEEYPAIKEIFNDD